MSVQPGPTFKRYAANGVATVYAIPFLLLDAADLQITLGGVPVTNGFTLSGIGNPTSSCTFTVAPTGDLLFLMVVPLQRLADYQINGDFLAQTVNRDYDRLWLAIKQLSRDNTRGLTVSLLEPEGIPPLPAKAARSLKMLAFDANGDPVTSNLTLAQLEQQPALALDSAAAAAASAVVSGQQAAASAASAVDSANSAAASAASAAAALVSENNAAATLATAQKQIQEITATVAANALTFGWVKTPISFRSATLTSGAVNTRNPASNLSLVVPSGATLGTVSGVQSRIVLLNIDGPSGVELAAINVAGGINLDETTLISTTAISSSANSASVAYSITARTNVPFRIAGFINVTQATAGTWATVPSTVQGAGGLSVAALSSIGYGKWANMTGTYVANTDYPNNTGKPIKVRVTATGTGGSVTAIFRVDGLDVDTAYPNGAGSPYVTVGDIVPPGSIFRIALTSATISAVMVLR